MSGPQGGSTPAPSRARSVRRITRWLAAAMGAVAVLSVVIAFLLDRVAGRAEYDSSPVVAIEILLAVIAVLAALICAALLLGLAVSSGVARLRRRPRRPAGAPPGGSDT